VTILKIFAADIGGTSIKTCIVNDDGVLEEFQEYNPGVQLDGEQVIDIISDLIAKQDDIDAIGISTTGQVRNGLITYSHKNIRNYTGTKVKEIIEKRFNIPTIVENDANAAALGELHYGSGKQFTDFLCLTFGTGIGGAIIIDSTLYKGSEGLAGEIGHMITRNYDEKNIEHYENIASTTALVKKSSEIDKEIVNGRILFEKLKQNNEELELLLSDWIKEISIGLVSLIHIFNPSAIILGGGIMEQKKVVDLISIKVNEMLITSFSNVKIINASLGNRAGLLGVASLHLKNR